MQKRHIVIINLVFFSLMLFSAGVVYQFLTGKKPLALLASTTRQAHAITVTTNNCSQQPAIAHLEDSADSQLRRLGTYQRACHSLATRTVMTFTGMPTSPQDAVQSADIIALKLQEFARYNIRPLVIAEPSDPSGNTLDFALLAKGDYDPWIDAYFAQLKAQKLTDQQMGIWNPFPEANLPYWKNNHPEYFAPAVNRYLGLLRKHFPQAQTSILLNSATYETTDFNWENGEYTSLLPYLKGIKPGLVNYAGLQGFPWAPPQGRTGAIFNAGEFLAPELLAEMADYLHIKNVWFNTGTFSVKYVLDPGRTIYVPPEQRKDIMDTIKSQAHALQKKGYTVAINLFAYDKSQESEETNWSYWKGNEPFASTSTPVLTDFIAGLDHQQTAFWLFDK